MKKLHPLLFTLLVVGVGLIAVRWCCAQSTANKEAKPAVPTHDVGLALHQLELLVAHLEATKDTKAMELFADYQHSLEGQQASAAIAINIRIILQKLREGRTQEVIDWQERRLESDAISLWSNYTQLSPAVREKLGLQSLGYARDYFAKFPRTDQSAVAKEGLARAFELLDDSSRKAK